MVVLQIAFYVDINETLAMQYGILPVFNASD